MNTSDVSFAEPNGYESYCKTVERVDTAVWGGHVELQALSNALQWPLVVYSVPSASSAAEVLKIVPENSTDEDQDPLRLSYHRHYYTLGEHYNSVIPMEA